MKALLAILCAVPALCSLPAAAQTYRSDEHAFRVVKLVEGLEQPWSLAFLPDGRMLVTEKAGRLRVIAQGRSSTRQPIDGLAARSRCTGRAACTTWCCTREFAKNQLVYLRLRGARQRRRRHRARARPAGGHRLEDVQVLFRQSAEGPRGQHFGGRIVFDRAGFVYLTLGDRGEMQRAQQPDDHAGSVIRLHDDGRVPKDNPFVGKRGLEAGEVHPRQPQHAGRGAASADRRAVDARARPAGRRRGERDPRRRELRLAGDHLRRQLRHRHQDRRGHAQGRHGAAAPLLGAVDRALGHGVLHRRQVPALEGRPLRRRAARPDAGAPASSTARRW